MSVYEDLAARNEPRDVHTPPSEPKLVEELIWLDQNVLRDAKGPTEPKEMVHNKAAWRLRISKREVRMFRLRRAGELAMSTTIAPLGIYVAVQSLSEGRVEGAAIGVMGILWSLGVGREVVKDFNSPEYMDLVQNIAREHIYHDAATALLEVS